MTPFRLAILSLVRRRVPTFIALFAIAISVACSGVLLRLYYLSGARFSTLAAGGDAVVGAKAGGIDILLGSLNAEGEYPDFLPYKLYESLKSEQTVTFEDGEESKPSYLESVIPVLFFGKYKNFRVMGTEEHFFFRPEIKDSIDFAEGAWAEGPSEIVLGSWVANYTSLKVGDEISIAPWVGSPIAHQRITFRVTGIMRATESVWDRMLYTNIRQAQEVLKTGNLKDTSIWGHLVVHYLLIYLKPDGLPTLEALINNRTVGQVVSVAEQKKRLDQLTGTGRHLGFLMTSFIMLLGGLSVAGMLVTRFEAMSMQFAVLRAIGYAKPDVGSWLLWEGFILGVAACIIGGALDALVFPVIRSMLGSALPAREIVTSSIILSAPVWITAISATMLAVFIPLIRLYRQDVHHSLRSV